MRTPLYEEHDSPRNPQKNLTSHKGLWFERFFNKYDSNWTVGDDAKITWIKGVSGLCGDKATLTSHSLAQQQLCDNLEGTSQIFKNNWHFVSCMGNDHPVENGMSWHPTLGTPYLAGAAVKGLLRGWLEQWSGLEGGELKEKLFRWFGSDDKEVKEQQKDSQAGGLIFFDAIPIDQVELTCDIMTPHMGKWYSNGGKISKSNYSDTLPADWHNPIPIPFLVVKQVSLLVSIAPRPHAEISQEELQEVMQMLTMALDYLGAGAKTATGYGRFDIDEAANKKLENSQKEASRNKMKPEVRFSDELKEIDDKKLAEMFGKDFKKTQEFYEEKNCSWESIIKILISEKKAVIDGWNSSDKNTAQGKAYKKLKCYL